jgi:predicted SprT family Zn-dependent metalloprotease
MSLYYRKWGEFGKPKYKSRDIIGRFQIIRYMGHSTVNKRNNRIMAKSQHWYRCVCACGTEESRSQQELNDKRRQQMCFTCRADPNIV